MDTPTVEAEKSLPADGRLEWDDGDWVVIDTDPPHSTFQKLIAAGATVKSKTDVSTFVPKVVALVVTEGHLTPRVGGAVTFPLKAADIDRISNRKIMRIFKAAMEIPELLDPSL